MRDALRTREQRVSELLGLERRIPFNVFKPFRGVARGVLDAQDIDAAYIRVVLERCREIARLCTHVSLTMRGNRIHCEEPRKCSALDLSAWPSRYFAKSRSQKAMPSS